jgi:hypothetical protein
LLDACGDLALHDDEVPFRLEWLGFFEKGQSRSLVFLQVFDQAGAEVDVVLLVARRRQAVVGVGGGWGSGRAVGVVRRLLIEGPLTPDPSPARGEGSERSRGRLHCPLSPNPSPARGEGSQSSLSLDGRGSG